MTHDKEFWERNICLNIDRDLFYTSDQVNTSYPRRFASVWIPLCDTNGLNEIIDRIRLNTGYKPMFMDGMPDEELDLDGWYEFSICINDDKDFPVDCSIQAEVWEARDTDNGDIYEIPLDKDDREIIYKLLDEELKRKTDGGCEYHLQKAREEMMDIYGDTIRATTGGW